MPFSHEILVDYADELQSCLTQIRLACRPEHHAAPPATALPPPQARAELDDELTTLVETAGFLELHQLQRELEHVQQLWDAKENRVDSQVLLDAVHRAQECLRHRLENADSPESSAQTRETAQSRSAGSPGCGAGAKPDGTSSVAETSPLRLVDCPGVSAELAELFADEATEHLQSLYLGLIDLEQNARDIQALHALRRFAHTLKGAAGCVGFTIVTWLAHRLEDLLDHYAAHPHELNKQTFGVMYATSDCLYDLIQGARSEEDLRPRLVQLEHLLTTVLPASGRPAARPSRCSAGDALGLPHMRTSERSVEAEAPQARSQSILRVQVEKLDELVNTFGELVVSRTGLEQILEQVSQDVRELESQVRSLRQVVGLFLTDQERQHALEFSAIPAGESVRDRLQIDPRRLHEFDALEFDRYTERHVWLRTLDEHALQVVERTTALSEDLDRSGLLLDQLNRDGRSAHQQLLQLRMVPLSRIVTRLRRATREVAGQRDRQVQLQITGEEVLLDKAVLDAMVDPLVQLIRNAVDHGIEPAAERQRSGKPACGTLVLSARQLGNRVCLEFRDDGRGLHVEALRQRARELGVTGVQDEADAPDGSAADVGSEDILDWMCAAGLSTADSVDDISGRGVGMDIVRETVSRYGGQLSVSTRANAGTRFTIQLPVTLAITRAVRVRIDESQFCIPTQDVQQIVRAGAGRNAELAEGREQLDLGRVLNLPRSFDAGPPAASRTDPRSVARARQAVALHSAPGLALVVDEILSVTEVAVKPLNPQLATAPFLCGMTIQGDGRVIPILDGRQLGQAALALRTAPSVPEPAPAPAQSHVFVIDDSPSVRQVTVEMLRAAGFAASSAQDGQEALERLGELTVPVDVFLVDIEMPRMDGFEFLTRLRELPEHHQTPAIVITSRGTDRYRRKALAAGAQEFLTKPWRADVLQECILRLIARF